MGNFRIGLLLLFFVGIFVVTGWILITYIPVLATQALAIFEPGIGLRTSAIIGFVLSVALLILFAIVSEGGILGEVEALIGSFFTFFFILTLIIAWIF